MNDALCLGTLNAVSINMAHNIMSDQFFALLSNIIIDIVLVSLKFFYLLISYVKSKLFLRLGKSNPKSSPGSELLIRGENVLHLLAGISFR